MCDKASAQAQLTQRRLSSRAVAAALKAMVHVLFYSERRLVTGLALAAFMLWKLTVANVISSAPPHA